MVNFNAVTFLWSNPISPVWSELDRAWEVSGVGCNKYLDGRPPPKKKYWGCCAEGANGKHFLTVFCLEPPPPPKKKWMELL